MARSKVMARGRTSVPAVVRRKLGIGPGSLLEWIEDGDKIIVRRAGRFSSDDIHRALFGKRAPATRTVDQMKQGIHSYVQKRHARD